MWQVHPANRQRKFRTPITSICLAAALVLGISACASPAPPPVERIFDKGTPYSDLLMPKLTASVADGTVGVAVDQPVTIAAEDGVLGAVTMTNENGDTVEGQLSPDGLTWLTAEPLDYNTRYTVSAQSLGLGGQVTRQLAFETHSPANLTMPYVVPGDGATVGIGQPVAVRFDENIPDRVAAERAIKITTNPPVEGAFYWLNNREVRWRPRDYWAPGTTVDVQVNTYGVDLGEGLFGQENISAQFAIGDAVIATADDDTKTLAIRVNGEVVKTMPISMGKNSTPTANGTYIIGDRFKHLIMDSSTYGVPSNSPNGYRTEVDFATQMSYSGVYVHAAPWSVGSQGYSNVSHGCLNVNTANAQWFYNNTKRGDVVEVRNTVGATLPGTEGLGDWNIPWEQWRAGNANA
jgi:lipoprotein-anchoring transpeptidase ErfK/SrfK